LLSFLSGITEGGTLPSFLGDAGDKSATAIGYVLATQVPLVFLALLGAVRLLGQHRSSFRKRTP
jgi:hypothetical protein